MTKSARILALAGFIAAAATPSLAAWVPVTAIPLDNRASIDVVDASRELPNRVEALTITPHDTDVACRDVTAFFRDGSTEQLFRGVVLPAGRDNVVHMLPVHRDVKRVDFHCRALIGPGQINIAANIAGDVVVDQPAGVIVAPPTTIAVPEP